MSEQNPPPTWPRGGPTGPPPSGPPPSGPPPGKGWPQAQATQPPYGGPPYLGGPPAPPSGPPRGPRRRRWPITLAGALAVLLVAGLSVTAWAYFTGRFGVGPLSARDKAAASAIADGVEAPEWADADARECAADELVHESRSADLEKRGLIEPDGDGWTYTGEWRYPDATTYVEALLDCDDEWAEQIGDEWELESTDCLSDDVGASTMAGFIVAESLTLSEGQEEADEARADAVGALDECYVADLPQPSAKARPAYRSVSFKFGDLGADAGSATLQVRDDGAWKPLDGNTHSVDTDAGGGKGCVEAKVEATFPWGTTTATEKRFCGRSKPPRIWWARAKKCTYTAGCTTWDLRYEGFASFDTESVRLLENGGDCNSESGRCEHTFVTDPSGRGVAISWSVYPGYDERFEARIRKMTAQLPS